MKEKELLYKQMEVFLSFFEKKFPTNIFTIEFRKVVNERGKTFSLSQLRTVNSDLMEMFRDAIKSDREELDVLLLKELNVSFNQLDKKGLSKINKIIKRGEINNIEEYYFLKSYQDCSDDKLADQINKLLIEFEFSNKDKSERL